MKTRKIIVKKIDENFEIASVRYSGLIELKEILEAIGKENGQDNEKR